MKIFSSLFNYIAWHYDDGSKVIWKSVQGFLRFGSKAFGTGAIFKLFPVPESRLNQGSFAGVIIGSFMHLVALLLRLSASIIGMVISIAAFASGIVIYIIWMIFPFIIVLFIITILRNLTVGL